MSFINGSCSIIRRNDKSMFYMNLDKDGLYYNQYDKNGDLIDKKRLFDNKNLDFTKYSFSLDKDNNIYCIYCDKSLEVLKCNNKSSTFDKIESITYNYKKFGLVFPYVKYIENNPHIFYYVFNNNSINTCALFHHYKHNTYWIENKIDFINHIVLDNFTVLWNESIPTIFYFNLVNGCEEVFASRFNMGTFTWSNPIQLTNSGRNKLYLNAIKDNINFYHLCFCEYDKNGYAVKYINGYLNENKFNLKSSTYVSEPSTCMYPSLVKNKSKLSIFWVNQNKLFTSTSNDSLIWSRPNIDEYSLEEEFIRSSFYSNYKDDLEYNVNQVFSTLNDVAILGL